ncbi:DUF6314 family protein [Frigidibacter sp. ROC022]|uniref:DUF6314 family protein n=1 Tax=Frigidibacter sp. ROC022 TaxID=2971796 RepID=UPI00215A0EAE|nr:DUF6314 family protein [Frigidibacter sp. ROC022]MCR8725559.1 DUF6314 family protein [Frigidibacter sp. ROC022]
MSAFQGRWLFRRQVCDSNGVVTARAEGTLSFTPDRDGLEAMEISDLRLPGQAPIRGERRTLWRQDGAGIAVFFGDGRPFHRFDPSAEQPGARHDCAPDLYRVIYDFSAWPIWSSCWRVTGPRKDYVMRSRHARDSAALASDGESGQDKKNRQETWEWPEQ